MALFPFDDDDLIFEDLDVSQTCNRYRPDGQPCTSPADLTGRTDGWCGQCEGFTQPRRGRRQSPPPPTKFSTEGTWLKQDPTGMDIAEASSISLAPDAVATYAWKHNVDNDEAETQIRYLLEDLAKDGQPSKRKEDGLWRLTNQGFALILDRRLSTVLMYKTLHRERTWAQVKDGVRSRVSRGGGWFGALPAHTEITLYCTKNAVLGWARLTDARWSPGEANGLLREVGRRAGRSLEGLEPWAGLRWVKDQVDSRVEWCIQGDGRRLTTCVKCRVAD